MFSYSFAKAYTLETLNNEIAQAGIPMISMDLTSNTEFTVNCANQLTNAQQVVLAQVVAAHIMTTDLVEIIANKILICRTFGIKMMARYGASNVLAQYNDEQIDDIIDRTAGVMNAINSGSLKAVIRAINKIQPDDHIITVEKLRQFRNEVEDFLQVPRT